MIFNEVYAVGGYVRIEGQKKPLTVSEVGKHSMKAIGIKGSKWFICSDNNKIVALNIRSNIKREVITPSKYIVLWYCSETNDFSKSSLMDERNMDIFIDDLAINGIKRIIIKEFKEC